MIHSMVEGVKLTTGAINNSASRMLQLPLQKVIYKKKVCRYSSFHYFKIKVTKG